MVAFLMHLFKLSLLFTLSSYSNARLNFWPETSQNSAIYPPTCSSIECPSYDVISVGDGFEIRRYNSTVWMSTSTINDISFVDATKVGFLQLFNYIDGKNDQNETIEMTAPVITQVSASDGPFCASSFVVSFYVPKENQAVPPSARGLQIQNWGTTYAAIRQFGGFVSDSDVGVQAAALISSLEGSDWFDAIGESKTSSYIVAQYNSPFEFENRVNEIWMTFSKEDENAA